MYYIGCQKKMNRVFGCDEAEAKKIGVDLTTEHEFLLENGTFELDCMWPLLASYGEICFRGKEEVTIIIKNAPKQPSIFNKEEEIQVFEVNADVIFQNVTLQAAEPLEIRFFNWDDAARWENVDVGNEHLRMVVMDQLDKGYIHSVEKYNVDGILEVGDHVVVDRVLYTHHGVYIGNNKLIHYSGEGGTIGEVAEISLEDFVKGDEFWVYKHEHPLSKEKIVKRAKSRLGENLYNMTLNNCEHFCHWCCTGRSWSNQIYAGSFLGPVGVILGKIVNEGDYKRYHLSDLQTC